MLSDKPRQEETILFLFREGMVCTTDFASAQPAPPSFDQSVKLVLRELPAQIQTDVSAVAQTFFPGQRNDSLLGS